MKEGWEYKKLGEIAEIKGGKRLPKGVKLLTTPTNHPYIRVADFNDHGTVETNDIHYISDSVYEQIKRYIIKKEDVYISIAGTIGKSGVIPVFLDGANLTENACRLILSNKLYQRFVYYYTISPSFIKQIDERTKKSAQPKLALTRLSDVIISYPPLSEQQSIVDYLDSAFAKIDAMKANAEKALNEAKALFQASLKEMLEPKEGWVTSTLKDECYKITDGTHQTPKYYPSGYIFLSSKNVTSRKIDWEDVKFIDESQHQLMYKRVAPQVGDILLAKNGTTGVAAMVDRDVVFDIYVSLALLRSRGNVTPEYLLAFVNSPIAKEQFDKRLIGMGVPNLHLGEINQVVITYPQDKVEQIRMTQRIEELDSLIIRLQANYEKISQECDALKQAILRQVFE